MNRAGYDFVFCDVDVVLGRDPTGEIKGKLDAYELVFMDDGARYERDSPFSANTGFYAARAGSSRVRAFLWEWLCAFDLIVKERNDQSVANMLLVEHVSRSGLRVEILPGGVGARQGGLALMFFRRNATHAAALKAGAAAFPAALHVNWNKGRAQKVAWARSSNPPLVELPIKLVCCGNELECRGGSR